MKSYVPAIVLATSALAVSAQNLVVTRANANKCLTVQGDVNANGTPVVISDCTGATGQLWTLAANPGSTQFRIARWNKCIDVPNGDTTDGTQLQIYTCMYGNNQLFTYPSTPALTAAIKLSSANKCVENSDGDLDNNNPVALYTCVNAQLDQEWDLVPQGSSTSSSSSSSSSSSMSSTTTGSSSSSTSATTSTTNSPLPAPTGSYIKPGKDNSLCLTGSTDNGRKITVQRCNGSAYQLWTYSGGRIYNTYNKADGTGTYPKCLDVTNGSTANGVKVQSWSCTPPGNRNQQWSVTGDNRIAWTNMHQCLDLTNGQTYPGNQIQSWHCTANNFNQVWYFVNP